MCLIVDANQLSGMFGNDRNADAELIWSCLNNGKTKIIYGGTKYLEEIKRVKAAARLIKVLSAAGQAFQANRASVDQEEERLIAEDALKSDDPHVIALARVTCTRLLYTRDSNLIDDFKNPAFIDSPRGKIYSRLQHVNLLQHTQGCPGWGKSKKKKRKKK